MSDQQWGVGVDGERPSAARVYDFFLGGHNNFAVDRQMAGRLEAVVPEIGQLIWANRGFTHRAVRLMAGAGVHQFVELGSGLPTAGSVHDVARRHIPGARVVYVDQDPVAVARGTELLADDPAAVVVEADLRDHAAVLSDPRVRRLIDPRKPIGVLLVGVLHELPGDEPKAVIAGYREAMAAGSFLALSQATRQGRPEHADPFKNVFDTGYGPGTNMTFRTYAEVRGLFEGFEIVEPGVVYVAQWRPDPGPAGPPAQRLPAYAGVGWLRATRDRTNRLM
ncbi:SAM-dependent methyltransferase [Phytohabitans rumicis]|uniref:S-adenosyl methyltransferase n=1 Tax=Phytohabitans rumicis TaxID=1076125 RepID=A0A6V8LG67_9ACTN|nr:SAM-dependent methyltransferase [Phytohabitans rumicis]GFJ93599.1 hypothetical protein Prum_072410 [Phytohabitans rumicis]